MEIAAEDEDLHDVGAAVRRVLETAADPTLIEVHKPDFKVFIGHGGDAQWEQVRAYCERAGYSIEAFESDYRAGQATLEVVENMIASSAVAVVVMTGADQTVDHRTLARQNVVHEIGFAQGKIGVRNTIILLEEGTEEFSNIAGITEVRFRKGEIHRTEKEVLATIANRKRDFEQYGPYGGGGI